MKILIIYGSTEGQTRKICTFLRDKAQEAGHEVSLNDASGADLHPKGFDAVIIGASLHMEKYQASVEHYIQEHQSVLNSIPGVFISVSLAAASNDPKSWEELKEITSTFLEQTGWHPTHVEQVAGALRYSKYNFLKKFIMRLIAQQNDGDTDTSEDYEYTDWNQVKDILALLENQISKKEA
ncbi:flavodoxin domain-containing protein [Fodinibius sediminis]|uniref:Menaquinone-dependent protoporphyrinogen oxidase n=1 Tax=Fodinibius sediminis TaxID=1214077 RepID=A0A521CU47_9BACT|nr:flavodoxin domain-containing protein [Fodinibius sediminis]SMO62932.1 menaquinone-dependent protoporphyrinogen oxidase [Fodinibius sediminis]